MASNAQSGRGTGQPHDALFRLVFGTPRHAASELRSLLPPALLARLDLEALEPVAGSFVDAALRHQHTDALFATTWAGRDAYLHVLIEHQSTPDPLMAFRLLRYQVRVWERHVRIHGSSVPLPVVVPVVLYQGARPWTVSTEFADLMGPDGDDIAALGALVPRFRYLLDDVSAIPATVLASRPLTPAARVALAALAIPGGLPDVTPGLAPWVSTIRELLRGVDGRDVLVAVVTYLWETSDTPERTMQQFVATVGPEVEEVTMSTAEKLRAEGRVQGQAEGRAQGQAEMLSSLLELRFGELDESTRAAIAVADPERIAAWGAQLIEGTLTLDDVTG